MLKIVRLYNQNKKVVWLSIIIAIFCIAIISLVNQIYQKNIEGDNKKLLQDLKNIKIQNDKTSNVVNYDKAANPLTSGESVHPSIREEVQKLLEQFVKSLTENNIQMAYSLLTEECKDLKYPSVENFAQSYGRDFIDKTYDFQLWTSSGSIYVYQVRFFDELLSTGRDTTKNYLQDYITVLKNNGVYRLNVNKLIKVENLERTVESQGIEFKVGKVETYLDYEIYEIEIINNTDNEIILDEKKQDKSVYVKNSDNLKIEALLHENTKEDLQINPKETKTIKIKFNNTYNAEKSIKSMIFSNIILDKEKEKKIEVEIYLR